MGIHGLTKLLADQAPDCMKEQKFENYFGRKIAVDASMHIYQFMVVVGRVGDQLLTNQEGEVTSHIQGMFYRTARMLEAGIRPVFVFDGKPPELKRKQLDQRLGRRGEAEEALQAAKESGNQEEIEKYSKRSVKVTKEHNDDCKKLLQLMGVPIVEAASEAEAQCAVMAKAGLVYGVATEDMDALTFGAPRLIRHLMAPQSSNQTISEFDRDKALQGISLTDSQFIDFCILCGCDYASTIKGIGPVRALQLVQKHGDMEGVLKSLDPAKYTIPEDWPWKEAHEFFQSPEVTQPESIPALKWSDPDEDGLVQFLVNEKNFSEDRVRKAVQRIKSAKGKAQQGRIESFFKPTGVTSSSSVKKPDVKAGDGKRKDAPGGAKGAAAKKGKLGGVGGGKKK